MWSRSEQRARAAQVGLLMRSYRESFSLGGGRRGLTQEALLERMGSVDKEYAERFSHATVSRWESGSTRPTLQRLKVFGEALNLSPTEIAGLVLLAGLAADFQTALGHVTGSRAGVASLGAMPDPGLASGVGLETRATPSGKSRSMLGEAARFEFLRVFPLGLCIVGGYALSLFGWNSGWMPTAYITFTMGIVLAQGFLFRDREAGLREFFWVSVFFLLTTPLLQFSRIHTDHYGFYTIGSLAGTQMPYMLALLLNLLIASTAGLAFQLLQKRQYSGASDRTSALRRAALVVLPPVIFAYVTAVVITNISVAVHLTVLLPVLGVAFAALLVLRDPAFNPNERDRLFLLSATSVLAMISAVLGIGAILAIYLSPDLPSVLPDHNLLWSWEINLAGLGFSREEALDRMNVGYVWHTTWVFGYMIFVVFGRLIVSLYRIEGNRRR